MFQVMSVGLTLDQWRLVSEDLREPLLLLRGDEIVATNRAAGAISDPLGWRGERSRREVVVDNEPLQQLVLHTGGFDKELEVAYRQLASLVDDRTDQLRRAHDKLHYELVERVQAQDGLEKAHRDLKSKQVQLVHSSKLAALGTMAAGITHEINNPLAFVSSNLDVLVNYLGSFQRLIREYRSLLNSVEVLGNEKLRESSRLIRQLEESENIVYLLKDVMELVEESREGARRVTEIIRGLKGYSRMDHNELRETDLHEGIDSTLKILSQELRSRNCTVNKHYGELPSVRCYPGRMNQVFLNLIVNAAQSLENKGEVDISTSVLGDEVEIAIRDNGRGIPEEKVSRIFDPFYSTKEEDEGTGLGLSISRRIVRDHKGELSVVSQVGAGSTFTVRIPIDPAPEEEETADG